MNDSKKIFNVRVIPHAKQNKVVTDGDVLRVYTTVAPENGRANMAVVELLADYFGVAKSKITVLRGQTSRTKIIAVE